MHNNFVWERILKRLFGMARWKLRTLMVASIFLLLLSSGMVYGQPGFERPKVGWSWGQNPLSPGLSTSVSVNVTNVSNVTMALSFVGVRFDWMKEGVYFIGGGSEKNRTLAPKESVVYNIAFTVNETVTTGTHQTHVLVAYNYNKEDGELANPPAVDFVSQIDVIEAGGLLYWLQGLDMTTIAIIVIAALIVLLERGRIRTLLKKTREKALERV
jgi:hypothetical protein